MASATIAIAGIAPSLTANITALPPQPNTKTHSPPETKSRDCTQYTAPGMKKPSPRGYCIPHTTSPSATAMSVVAMRRVRRENLVDQGIQGTMVRPHCHNFAFFLSGSYQYSNPRRLRSAREPQKNKRVDNRIKANMECARNLRPEVTTVSAGIINRP